MEVKLQFLYQQTNTKQNFKHAHLNTFLSDPCLITVLYLTVKRLVKWDKILINKYLTHSDNQPNIDLPT